jgi:hypothetical protein
MDDTDRSEEPNLNTGTPWSAGEDEDIRWGLEHNRSNEETADFLCRTRSEVRERVGEIAEADALGDPSLLDDRLPQHERTSLETCRDARAAMALICEAVEDCAPPGSVTREGYLTPEFTVEAKALVRAIYAIGGREANPSGDPCGDLAPGGFSNFEANRPPGRGGTRARSRDPDARDTHKNSDAALPRGFVG